MQNKVKQKPIDSEKAPPRKPLTRDEIEEALKRGARNAAELDKRLRQIFRLPDRILRLD